MASGAEGRVRAASGLVLAALGLVVCLLAQDTMQLSVEQASSRNPNDFSPAYAGKRVAVRGIVSSAAFHFLEYDVLPFHGERGGMAIRSGAADTRLDAYLPGDELEIVGVVSQLAGMPVIDATDIRLAGRVSPAPPERVPVIELQGFRHLGRLVQTEGSIVEVGETTHGAYFLIESGKSGNYKVFLPFAKQRSGALPGLHVGDRVSVTGVAFQYCPRPPFNRWFEVLVHDAGAVALVQRSGFVPTSVIVGITVLFSLVGYAWWFRERRLAQQRERMRQVYQLGEEILSAPGLEGILARVSNSLPKILGITRVRLYLHNRANKTLESVGYDGSEVISIRLASPPGGTYAGAAACFHYRTLLSIPDLARSPFPVTAPGQPKPKSLLLVPMMAQGEVVGVFELDQDGSARDFSIDEQALAQHLGNQIGVAMRLLDQRSVQEQLHRSEKLAAVGRLISGVVNELQAPLASIAELSLKAQQKPHPCPAEREVRAIAAEAEKAGAIMARLVSFASEPVETKPVDINALIGTLIDFRGHDWKASGIRVRDLRAEMPLWVVGWQGQLEQVLLNLLVYAEQSAALTAEKTISVQTSLLAKRVLVEIGFSAPKEAGPDDAMAVLGVARSIIGGHGGEVRLVKTPNGAGRFELELPGNARERNVPNAAPRAATGPPSTITVLVIEPDEAGQRQLLTLLSVRGCRAVPVNDADTGLEIAQRLRFDFVFCSVHSQGLNWVELSERLQGRAGAFVLLSDGYDPELAADFEGEGRFVLAKPVQETELDQVLAIGESASTLHVGTA